MNFTGMVFMLNTDTTDRNFIANLEFNLRLFPFIYFASVHFSELHTDSN